MEPILGTLAFCLLGFQFFRNNMQQARAGGPGGRPQE